MKQQIYLPTQSASADSGTVSVIELKALESWVVSPTSSLWGQRGRWRGCFCHCYPIHSGLSLLDNAPNNLVGYIIQKRWNNNHRIVTAMAEKSWQCSICLGQLLNTPYFGTFLIQSDDPLWTLLELYCQTEAKLEESQGRKWGETLTLSRINLSWGWLSVIIMK